MVKIAFKIRCLRGKIYLCHFEELWELRHPVKELLVDVQGIFTLVLLHVKVFLCVPEDEKQLKKQNLLWPAAVYTVKNNF